MTVPVSISPPPESQPASVVPTAPPRPGWLRRMLGKLVWPVVILVGILAWLSVNGWGRDHRETLPPGLLLETESPTALMVTAEPVAFRPVQRVVEATGTLYGYEELVISAKVAGRVQRIHYEVADRVTPETLLVEIEPTEYQLAVEQAEQNLLVELSKLGLQQPPEGNVDLANLPTVMLARAKLDNARSRLDRVARLNQKGSVSQSELDNATSDFRTAEAEHANQLLLARSGVAMIGMRQSALAVSGQQLADTRVQVPSPHRAVPGLENGVVYVITRRSVSEGTYVRVGDEICRLAIDKTLKLRVPVADRFTTAVQLGQKADVQTAAFPSPFSGVVTLINPAVDPVTRTFDVEIQVANDQALIKPGSFAKATIHTSESDHTATVPLSALVSFAGVTKIFLVRDGKAVEVQVTPGVQTRDWVEIAKPGLPADSLVVTSGQSALADQTPIAIRPPAAPAQSPTASASADTGGAK